MGREALWEHPLKEGNWELGVAPHSLKGEDFFSIFAESALRRWLRTLLRRWFCGSELWSATPGPEFESPALV